MLKLSRALKMNYSTLHEAVERLRYVRLVGNSLSGDRLIVNQSWTKDLLLHSLRFLVPAREGAAVRGLPTGYAAPVFSGVFVQGNAMPPVWPYAHGTVVGARLEPLVKNAPTLALEDPDLYAYMAIVDALRSGGAREVLNAKNLLVQKLEAAA